MKRFQYISFLAILVMAIVSFSSCFQYPEGPIFTMQLPDERLKGSWLITGFTDANGNDMMSEHQNQTMVADYSHGGDRSWAEFKNNQLRVKLEARDNIAKSFSCKAAIKAGERLSETEMRSLIDQLFATSMPYVCPHGRPVLIKLSLAELDRRFFRT